MSFKSEQIARIQNFDCNQPNWSLHWATFQKKQVLAKIEYVQSHPDQHDYDPEMAKLLMDISEAVEDITSMVGDDAFGSGLEQCLAQKNSAINIVTVLED